jgi:hypothetical protein
VCYIVSLDITKMSKLINVTNVRAFALSAAQRLRPCVGFERVSADFTDRINAKVRAIIEDEIRRLPSVGVTIK